MTQKFKKLKALNLLSSCFMMSLCLTLVGCGNNQANDEKQTITFKNYDGEVLKEYIISKGETVEYDGNIPTHPATEQYNYIFSGWDETNPNEFVATYTEIANKYIISFDTNGGEAISDIEVNYGAINL